MIEHTTQWVLDNSPDPLDPTEIDWAERQARALIPFEVIGGRPEVPIPQFQRLAFISAAWGRNGMKFWGENPMADALVTCTYRGVRYVLLIEREDGQGWAMPGGAIESGETPYQAALRELTEETGLIISAWAAVDMDDPRWVPDPRGSMEAWPVTVVARCDIGEVDALPEVRGGDDARTAAWWSVIGIHCGIDLGQVFPAHREILKALR